MKPKSVKAKVRKLQNLVRDKLREVFVHTTRVPSLHEDDIKSQTMGMCGEDIVLSPAARKKIPYSFECKNQEALNIWKSLKQAEDNCGDRTPILIFKRNRTLPYVVMPFQHFIDILEENER